MRDYDSRTFLVGKADFGSLDSLEFDYMFFPYRFRFKLGSIDINVDICGEYEFKFIMRKRGWNILKNYISFIFIYKVYIINGYKLYFFSFNFLLGIYNTLFSI